MARAIDEIAYEGKAGTILVENPLLAEYVKLGHIDRLRELAQADREKNDPLTLDELRGMRGKWVWVVSPDKDLTVSAWAYVGANHVFTYWEYDNDELVGRVVYNLCDYGAWIAYRNPIKTVMPGEEQHGV